MCARQVSYVEHDKGVSTANEHMAIKSYMVIITSWNKHEKLYYDVSVLYKLMNNDMHAKLYVYMNA